MLGVDLLKRTISYAQNSEDIVLLRALQDLDCGFYIDLGAADPVYDSVTKLFYDKGWTGINVEPNEEFYQLLCSERIRDINLCMAASSVDGTKEIDIFSGSGLSTLECRIADSHKQNGFNPVRKTTRTLKLNDIINEFMPPHKEINFLKVDVEGHEEEVIRAFDLAKFRPWIIIYEATKPNTNIIDDGLIPCILEGHGYTFCFFDGINKYFVSKEMEERRSSLFPANVLDNYIRFENVAIYNKIMTLENNINTLNNLLKIKNDQLSSSECSYNLIKKALAEKDIELSVAANNYHAALNQIQEKSFQMDDLEKSVINKLKEADKAVAMLQRAIELKDNQLKDAGLNYDLLLRRIETLTEEMQHAKHENSSIRELIHLKDNELKSAANAYQLQADFIIKKEAELCEAALAYQILLDAFIEKEKQLQIMCVNAEKT